MKQQQLLLGLDVLKRDCTNCGGKQTIDFYYPNGLLIPEEDRVCVKCFRHPSLSNF